MEVREESLGAYELENLAVLPLLFQTGYLTIKGYDNDFMTYILGYPNFEVENSFQYALLNSYSNMHVDNYVIDLIRTLRNDDFETFFDTLRNLFCRHPIRSSNQQGKILSNRLLSYIFSYRLKGGSGSKNKQRQDRRCYY